MIELSGNFTLIIGVGMIGNSNYVGTSLSRLIQEVKSKEENYSNSSNIYINIDQNDRTAHWFGHSLIK